MSTRKMIAAKEQYGNGQEESLYLSLRLPHTRLRNVRYYNTRTHTTSLKNELKEENDLGPTFSSSFNFLWSFLHLTETKVEKKGRSL